MSTGPDGNHTDLESDAVKQAPFKLASVINPSNNVTFVSLADFYTFITKSGEDNAPAPNFYFGVSFQPQPNARYFFNKYNGICARLQRLVQKIDLKSLTYKGSSNVNGDLSNGIHRADSMYSGYSFLGNTRRSSN